MLPVIAIVGRPNVGKSTLFNCLTKSNDAIVADFPGITRDRIYGLGSYESQKFIVIDTGGLAFKNESFSELIANQVHYAIDEANVIFLVVDAKDGLCGDDHTIVKLLRSKGKCLFLVINKAESRDPGDVKLDFFQLGLGDPFVISAAHRMGISALLEETFTSNQFPNQELLDSDSDVIRIAIVGRPNVGKSTLVNRILGENRQLVFDSPGTTRDSINIPFEQDDKKYILIDTAGIRKRKNIADRVEKTSVVKSLQAIESAHVVIMVIDAQQDIGMQDTTLLGFILDSGKALILAINKWDGLEKQYKNNFKLSIERKLYFIDFAEFAFISALHGTGVGKLIDSVEKVYKQATQELSTSELTRMLAQITLEHPPPLFQGRRIKLRYAHQGGRNPPIIVIHGNQTDAVPKSYSRFLLNRFRKLLSIQGTPMRVEFKSGSNPFANRKNKLSKRQIYKRKRLMQHVKKRK